MSNVPITLPAPAPAPGVTVAPVAFVARVKPNILQFLEEDNGTLSSTRLAFLLWVVGVLVIWTDASWHAHALQAIPSSLQVILGILMTGKVTQKFGETKAEITPGAAVSPANNPAPI